MEITIEVRVEDPTRYTDSRVWYGGSVLLVVPSRRPWFTPNVLTIKKWG